jgi:hypothetical protein
VQEDEERPPLVGASGDHDIDPEVLPERAAVDGEVEDPGTVSVSGSEDGQAENQPNDAQH